MLKVPSFHILSPLRGEGEGKKIPFFTNAVWRRKWLLGGGPSLCPGTPEAVCCSLVSFQDRLGTATKCCKCILREGSGCWSEVLGTFPFPAEYTWHTSLCKCTFVRFPLGLVIFLFLKWLGSNKPEGQGVFRIYCSFCIFFPFLNQSLI